jgi:thermitase
VANGGPPAGSGPTHGLSMAATIVQGLASVKSNGKVGLAVRIQLVDVYGTNATTTTFDVANGIARAVNAGANPINLSLGTTGDSAFLHRVIENASSQGVIFFGAAGNEPVATPTFPAAYPEVVAVTAGDRQGHIASYANRGNFVKAMAPGASVVCYNGQSWLVQGTSTATAFARGVAAGAAALGANAGQAAAAVTNNLPVGTTGQ